MTVRLDSVSTPFPQARLTLRAAIAATAFALAAATGAAHAQGGAAQAGSAATAATGASAAAAGASAAPAALPVVGQYTVHPGQSLHDVAVDLTQSHDKTVLARASSALFDANPNAFMKHDPSRLKVGAMLNVPGTPDMASAGAASGVTAASAPAAPATTASAPAAATAPASAATPNTAAATGATAAAASAVAAANAGASAATAATAATAGNAASSPATVAGAASEAAGASAPETASAATAASAAGASAALASGASGVDQHSFSGSVQAASAASAASAPVSVSSLQQLLALKNRVLMALQHGNGKPAQVASGANGASGAQHAPAGAQGAQQPEVSPVTLGVVAAIVLAFVALLVRLLMRKRRKPAAAADAPAATETPVAPTAPVAPPAGTEAEADMPVLDEPLTLAPTATAAAAAGAAAYAQTHTDADAALDHATDAASLSAAAELGADALPPTLFDKLEPTQAHGPDALREDRAEHGTHPQGVAPGEPETLADATDAASFAAAAELGASALPPEGLAAQRTVGEMDEHARRAEAEPHPIEMTMPGEDPTHSETHDQPLATEATEAEGEPAPFAPPAREPQPLELRMPGDPEPEPAAPAEPVVPAVSAEESMPYQEVPQEFPKTAVDALGSIEMSLPPRVEVPDAPAMPDFPFTTEPSATSGATLGQPLPFGQPPAPLAGQAIEAGTAGIGSIAGLGAPRFGTLSLDFDLNLPPDSAEPLPVFSPDQLARIARNKLDLAHEYIALGDLSGARALINEVIESSDHATRADAQALLSTLSPLS